MSSTKTLLAEQILFRLEAGYPDGFNVQIPDIVKAIEQKINAIYRTEHFSITLPAGERIPDNATLTFHEGITVSAYGDVSKATLPMMPVNLPRNLGCFDIADPNGKVSFIPMLATQRILLKSQPLINDLLGQVGYEMRGKTIVFSKNLLLYGVSTVNALLVGMDISTYSETDALPISASIEEQIVTELVEQFAGVQATADAKEAKKK